MITLQKRTRTLFVLDQAAILTQLVLNSPLLLVPPICEELYNNNNIFNLLIPNAELRLQRVPRFGWTPTSSGSILMGNAVATPLGIPPITATNQVGKN